MSAPTIAALLGAAVTAVTLIPEAVRTVTRHVARVTPCKNPAETENPQ